MRFKITRASYVGDDLICYDMTTYHILENAKIHKDNLDEERRLLNKINEDLSKI